VKGGALTDADGSVDLYFAPQAPTGKESNWIQTIPGKSWRPGEIEMME
jgi:hypothetical protein